MGLIARTVCENSSEEELKADLRYLLKPGKRYLADLKMQNHLNCFMMNLTYYSGQ